MKKKLQQQKLVSGTANTGRLIFVREDQSTAVSGVVVVRGVSLTDNNDSTFDLTFSS